MKNEHRIDWRAVLARALPATDAGRRYTADEAAELLGVKKSRLFYHHTVGSLPGRRVSTGRASVLELSGRELIRWLREQVRYAILPKAA